MMMMMMNYSDLEKNKRFYPDRHKETLNLIEKNKKSVN